MQKPYTLEGISLRHFLQNVGAWMFLFLGNLEEIFLVVEAISCWRRDDCKWLSYYSSWLNQHRTGFVASLILEVVILHSIMLLPLDVPKLLVCYYMLNLR